MKTKTFYPHGISLLLFVIILQFAACGNDSTVNNNVGSGTLLFSLDSLVLNVPENGFANDTTILLTNEPNIKITFDCATNADSINSFALYRIVSFVDTNYFIDTVNRVLSQLNRAHAIYISGSDFYYCSLIIQLIRNDSLPYFIKLKNVRVFEN
jgi:hypothetical protein